MQVDSVGYMCSFAVFDFERHGDAKVSDYVCEATWLTLHHMNIVRVSFESGK